MAGMDIFDGNAFSTVELTAALNNVPYKPSFLGSLGIFEPTPVRTETIAIEQRDGQLSIIQTSPRGAPLDEGTKDPRNIRDFRTVRIAKGRTIQASEIQNIRAFGSLSELEQVQDEIMRESVKLRQEAELTYEHMRLGAVQGIVMDADGSVIRNWFTEFGIQQPAEIDFDLDAANPASGAVRKKCSAVIRDMVRASKGAWVPGRTYVMGLAGDDFYDALTTHKEVQQTYLNQQAAAELRNDVGNVFEMFRFGQITFVNYRGTDDKSTVHVDTDKCYFFPVGANGAFQHAMSPGEAFEWTNQLGQPFYELLVRDLKRNMWVRPEIYGYPLFICTRPGMLLRAKRT